MPTPTNYSELITAVQALVEDDSAELLAYLPTAIGLAEAKLFRALDVDWSTLTSSSTTSGNPVLAKPAGYKVGHNIYVTVAGERVRLIKKTEDFIYDYWPNASTTDVPKYYADRDSANFILAPTPNSNYTVAIEHEAAPTALSSSNTTNRYTTDFPEALFYATVAEAAAYLHYPEMVTEYNDKLMAAVEMINAEGRRLRTDDAKNVANPETGRNIKGQA